MYRSVNKKSYWRGDGWFGPAAVFSFVAAGALIVMSIAMIPYSTEYYYLYRVSGNVESVTNKMVESSGEFSQHTVLTLDTVDRPVEMSDPRGVTLQGKDVDLTCSINWHYMAQDTYHCEIYSIGDTR